MGILGFQRHVEPQEMGGFGIMTQGGNILDTKIKFSEVSVEELDSFTRKPPSNPSYNMGGAQLVTLGIQSPYENGNGI